MCTCGLSPAATCDGAEAGREVDFCLPVAKIKLLGGACALWGGSQPKLSTHHPHRERQVRSAEVLCELKGVGRRALLAPFEIFRLDSHLAVESNFILALNLDFQNRPVKLVKGNLIRKWQRD